MDLVCLLRWRRGAEAAAELHHQPPGPQGGGAHGLPR